MAYSSLFRGHKAAGKVSTRPGLHLRLEVLFQAHLVCLQQSVPILVVRFLVAHFFKSDTREKDCLEWSESHSVVSDSLWPRGLYSAWNSPGQNTGMGSLSLLQGIFPTQRSYSGLPHCRWILYQLSHKESPSELVSKMSLTYPAHRMPYRPWHVHWLEVSGRVYPHWGERTYTGVWTPGVEDHWNHPRVCLPQPLGLQSRVVTRCWWGPSQLPHFLSISCAHHPLFSYFALPPSS